MIGIIAAMKPEMDLIKKNIEGLRSETKGSIEFYLGKINGRDVVCSVCGIGKVYASMCTEAMIIAYSPDYIINTGIGGTLTRDLSIGDVAISRNVCQHDMDTSPIGDEIGYVSGIGRIYFDADETLMSRAEDVISGMGVKCVTGTIASGDQFVATQEKKDFIKKQFGAICCEMEGAAIGHVCAVNNVPFVVVRSISDDADEGACDNYLAFTEKAANVSASAILEIIK